MKKTMIALSLIGATVTTATFAQAQTESGQPSQAIARSTENSGAGTDQQYEQPLRGKTRAQVYEELVQAQKDGSLQRLNSTLYAHP